MKQQPFLFYLVSLTIYLIGGLIQPAGASPYSLGGDNTHSHGVIDGWAAKRYSDPYQNRRYARSFAANQNVGQPRTVRMIYFLPNDRPYRADVVQRMKDEIRTVQTFFADQMEAHGYGRRTFRVATNAQGEPIVHRVDGQHPDSYYLDDADVVYDELTEALNDDVNIYLIVIDNSIGQVCSPDGCFGGWGGSWGKQGGEALVSARFDWYIVAHELGHAFRLGHDFRDGAYIMSYGPGENQLAACSAEYLAVHPYFNPDTPIDVGEPPTIELISSPLYPAGSRSVSIRVRVSDPDGLHQVILHAAQPDNRSSVKSCRGLSGEKSAIIEFDYDGVIPSAHDPAYSRSTSLLSPPVHEILIGAVDAKGDVSGSRFALISDDLQLLSKISGDNQAGLPNTPLPVPFVVELRDLNDGYPLLDIPITFRVTAGGGRLSDERVKTDYAGRAESLLTLGPHLGENRVDVSAEGLIVTFTAVAGAAVGIPDKNLRIAVETELEKARGQPIAPSDMASLTLLYAWEAGIRNLTGLETATHLTFLDLSGNSVSDLSPLAGLTRLRSLSLGRNLELSDLSPLVELTNLTYLAFSENSISDISALVNLTNLATLQVSFNSISDISALAGLTHLRWLYLERNAITDISAVAGLTNLIELRLHNNGVSDISAVANLTNLTSLELPFNSISDLSPLVANTGLGSGDEVDVRGNPLNYLSIMAHIPALQSRGVTVEFDDTAAKPPDVNGDGNVNVLDLLVIVSKLGEIGTHIATDISGDGVVDILDLVLVAGMFESAAAAPSVHSRIPETITAVEVRQWLTEARSLEMRDPIIKRGIMMLEQLLVSLTPTEAVLLANYPNPFNPETWIPYRLADDGFVTLTIYNLDGQVIRTLDVGHRIASAYESRLKAIHWDGRNEVGEQVASGVYFYTLTAGEYSATRKMLILK